MVNALVAHYRKLTKTFDALDDLMGSSPDSEIYTVVWAGFEAYTKAVSVAIGDNFDYVSWYIWDNSCGKRGLEVSWNNGNVRVFVKTAKDLIKVIDANERSGTCHG